MPDWRTIEFEGKYGAKFALGGNKALCQHNEPPSGAEDLKPSDDKLAQHGNGKCPADGQSASGMGKHKKTARNTDALASTCVKLSDGKCYDAGDPEPSDNSRACNFALGNTSPAVNIFLQDDIGYEESDLPFFGWNDIDNFEDVDRLFRKCDSTYGQQQTEAQDDLSWIPSSSDAIYSSELGQTGPQYSYADFDELTNLTDGVHPEQKIIPASDHPSGVFNKSFDADYEFSDDRVDDFKKDKDVQTNGNEALRSDAKLSAVDEACCNSLLTVNKDLQMVGKQLHSTENTEQLLTVPQLSVPLVSKGSASHNISEKKHSLASSSSYITSNSCTGKFSHGPLAEVSFLRVSTGNKFDNMDQLTNDPMMVDNLAQQVFADGPSMEEISFMQLQDAVSRLDLRTKLCIRDGLYRLARSFKQRHDLPSANDCGVVTSDAGAAYGVEASDRCLEQFSVETHTNPIDRSIALLLFHRPSDQIAGANDAATSFESRITEGAEPLPVFSPGAFTTQLGNFSDNQ